MVDRYHKKIIVWKHARDKVKVFAMAYRRDFLLARAREESLKEQEIKSVANDTKCSALLEEAATVDEASTVDEAATIEPAATLKQASTVDEASTL